VHRVWWTAERRFGIILRVTNGKAFAVLTLAAAVVSLGDGAARAAAQPASAQPRGLATQLEGAVKGDADAMIEARVIRVAAPYSRSLYFNDKGRERGLSADFVRDFERFVNAKYKKQLRNRPVTVVIRPTTRDVLLKNVVDGLADIAVGNLTVTEERLQLIDFAPPHGATAVSEIVLTGPAAPRLGSADELSGRTVHVRRASSYHESLVALNERLEKDRKPPVKLVLVPDALEDEDMMEMLNAGLLQVIVVDDWKARMWAQVLPRITVNDAAIVRSGGKIGWAIRKGSPKLAALLEEFYTDFVKKQGVLNARMKQYNSRVKALKNPTASAEWKRFEDTLALFKKYGAQYHFDPLMLAAQGYQESQLKQSARSHVGAVGIMQVMPATGKELKVGDIRIAEPNVHAGAKYMDQLMTRYLKDANFDDTNRTLFAFACYNAGPGNISRMRKEAVRRRLDPDQWFNNVELVTAERIGIETTTYVRNIYKYYVAYKLMVDVEEAQEKARATVAPRK
jgi:membrane-bound lytic murein transglycosylase MltF